MSAEVISFNDHANEHGRLADNIVYFSRALRHAGLRLGPASVTDSIKAVIAAGIGSRDDFYWTLHCVLVKRHEDRVVFDETFRLFWKSRELVEKLLAMFSPVAPDTREKQKKRAGENRAEDALFSGHEKQQEPEYVPEIDIDARFTVSEREVLREIATGASSKEAGRILGISPRTVEVHRARIMDKLGARNAADLMRIIFSHNARG